MAFASNNNNNNASPYFSIFGNQQPVESIESIVQSQKVVCHACWTQHLTALQKQKTQHDKYDFAAENQWRIEQSKARAQFVAEYVAVQDLTHNDAEHAMRAHRCALSSRLISETHTRVVFVACKHCYSSTSLQQQMKSMAGGWTLPELVQRLQLTIDFAQKPPLFRPSPPPKPCSLCQARQPFHDCSSSNVISGGGFSSFF